MFHVFKAWQKGEMPETNLPDTWHNLFSLLAS